MRDLKEWNENSMKTSMMNRLYFALLCTVIAPLGINAQQEDQLPSRSMTIEGVYNAEHTEASKIMPVPERYVPHVEQERATYLTEGQPSFSYSRASIDAPGSLHENGDRCSGLLKLGYGIRNDLDALADIRVRSGERGMFKANAVVSGLNSKIEEDWRSKDYDMGLNLGYSYSPDRFRLDINGNVGYGFLNFRKDPYLQADINQDRNIFDAGVNAGITSVSSDGLDYSAEMGWSIFLDDRMAWMYNIGSENLFRFKGSLGYDFESGFAVSLGLDFKTSLMNCGCWKKSKEYENFTTVSAQPRFSWTSGKFRVSAGADVTLRSLLSPVFRISPNISLRYAPADAFALFADLKGGVEEYDMRSLRAISPYWMSTMPIYDGYRPLDAAAGFILYPFNGMELTARAGYVKTLDKAMQVPYVNQLTASCLVQYDAEQLFAGLSCKYVYSDRISAYASAEYSKWSSDEETGAVLAMLPQFELKCGGQVGLMNGLRANIDFTYASMTAYDGFRLPHVADLDLGAVYSLSSRLDLGLKCRNLLNSRHFRYAGVRNTGFSVQASVLYRF